jgi:predicted RNA-binding protein with PUA domain
MNWQAEEDDRLDAELAEADWCQECNVPIGCGWCDGCIAVSCSITDTEYLREG